MILNNINHHANMTVLSNYIILPALYTSFHMCKLACVCCVFMLCVFVLLFARFTFFFRTSTPAL